MYAIKRIFSIWKGAGEGKTVHFGQLAVVTFKGVDVKIWESGLQVGETGMPQGVVKNQGVAFHGKSGWSSCVDDEHLFVGGSSTENVSIAHTGETISVVF
jgi:hypothetical protein